MRTEAYVCSNCGAGVGVDTRMGAVDDYLICTCADQCTWVDDGRGGYPVYAGDARPVPISQYRKWR